MTRQTDPPAMAQRGGFVSCYLADDRDIFWLRDESIGDSENLPQRDQIAEGLGAVPEQLEEIARIGV